MKVKNKIGSVPKPALSVRERKENAIIEASVKQLDTKHLTELVFRLMREQLRSLSDSAFEISYAKARLIRQRDADAFPTGNLDSTVSLQLLWVDRANKICSEKKNIQFVEAEGGDGVDHEGSLLGSKFAIAN